MLDQFRAQKLEWNRANNQIYDRVETSSGDSNGRTLFVQISNGGTVEDLTGATLSLAWSKRAEQGLETFEEVDAKKGQFRLFYPTGMLVNQGVLRASLVLVDVTGRIESKPFDIIVHKGTVDDEAVESDNKFTALTTALVKVSQVQAEFDGLYADKSQMMDTLHDDKKADMEALEADYSNRANTLEATYAPRLTEVSAQLAQKAEQVEVNATNLRIDNLVIPISPENANIAVTDAHNSIIKNKNFLSLKDRLEESEDDLAQLDYDLTKYTTELNDQLFTTSTNLYNLETRTVGYRYNFYNEYIQQDGWSISDYIPVKDNINYTYSDLIYRVTYFDRNKVLIGFDEFPSGEAYHVRKTLPRTRYVRIQGLSAMGTTAQVNLGDELLPFEPYYNELKSSTGIIEPKEIKLQLEADGINKTNGKIKSVKNETVTLADIATYKTTRRTGKYLSVKAGTEIKLVFSEGLAFVFEYDNKFNFIRYNQLSSGQNYKLDDRSKRIKILIEGLPEYCKMPTLIYAPVDGETWVNNERYANSGGNIEGALSTIPNISFIYEVQTDENRHILGIESSEQQKQIERYFNSGLLRLPPNYSPTGDPVKLIIWCQGSSSYFDFQQKYHFESGEEYIQYLCDEGYAVLSVFRWTTKYYPEVTYQNDGSPIVYSALAHGYQWVISNYNIDQNGVFVSGKSSGGYTGLGLAYNKGIPVNAVGMMVPTISNMTTTLNSNVDVRKAMARDYGFVGDYSVLDSTARRPELEAFFMSNARKMIGYMPYWDGIVNSTPEALMSLSYSIGSDTLWENVKDLVRVCRVPIKIWSAEDDIVESIPPQHKVYIHTLQNGNSIGELRLMPIGTGGHDSVDSSPNALKVNITTKLGIERSNVPLAYAELISWFRRFGG